jgi:hypothetical protein
MEGLVYLVQFLALHYSMVAEVEEVLQLPLDTQELQVMEDRVLEATEQLAPRVQEIQV